MKRHRLLKLGLLLLAGAIVNVLMAWGGAIVSRRPLENERSATAWTSSGLWDVLLFTRPGEQVLISRRLNQSSQRTIESQNQPEQLIRSWAPFDEPTAEYL